MRGGVLGKKIEFILEDEKCNGAAAVSGFQKLIEQDKVDIILGPSCTPASGAVAPLTDKYRRLIIAFTSTASGIFDKYEYAFRTSPPADEAATVIAQVARNKYQRTRVFTVSEKTDFGKSWTDRFVEQFTILGGVVIGKEEYATGQTDFRNIILKLLSNKPDMVYISAQSPQDAGLIIKQLLELGGNQDIFLAGNPVLVDEKTIEIVGQKFPKNNFTIVPQSANKDLLNKYVSIYNEQPGFQFFYTASAYDMVYLLKNAIEKCKGTDNDCLKKYLLNNSFEGQVTTWKFNELGDPITNNIYVETSIVSGQKQYSPVNTN